MTRKELFEGLEDRRKAFAAKVSASPEFKEVMSKYAEEARLHKEQRRQASNKD